MSDSLIQLPAMASGASLAGTCLMQTRMFIAYLPGEKAPASEGGRYKTLHGIGSVTVPKLRSFASLRMTNARWSGYFPAQRLKIRAALVPPKPNEFESA